MSNVEQLKSEFNAANKELQALQREAADLDDATQAAAQELFEAKKAGEGVGEAREHLRNMHERRDLLPLEMGDAEGRVRSLEVGVVEAELREVDARQPELWAEVLEARAEKDAAIEREKRASAAHGQNGNKFLHLKSRLAELERAGNRQPERQESQAPITRERPQVKTRSPVIIDTPR